MLLLELQGKFNMKKVIALMLIAVLTLATFSVFAAEVKFSDTDSEAILALAEKGIILEV